MYHIKKIKIFSFSILSALLMTIIYFGGSIVLFGIIITLESNFFQYSSYMIGEIINLGFLGRWFGIGLIVFLGVWGLSALIAVIYNAFGAAGKGLKLDIELLEDK